MPRTNKEIEQETELAVSLICFVEEESRGLSQEIILHAMIKSLAGFVCAVSRDRGAMEEGAELVSRILREKILGAIDRPPLLNEHIARAITEARRPAPTSAENAQVGDALIYTVLADIREKTGVGSGPMLSELADAIAARIAAMDEALAKLETELTCPINGSHYCPNCDNSLFDALEIVRRARSAKGNPK